jgi:hypothetical protein
MAEKNTKKTGRILLNTQMIADELMDKRWSFLLNSKDAAPVLKGFEIYTGKNEFADGTIYLLPAGKSKDFPIDKRPYITTEDIFGAAPHIRSVDCSDEELLNALLGIFETYHQFESDINDVLINNGSLNDLCRIGIKFFHNPMYIHDRMFTVIALPEYKEGMIQFERSDSGSSIHIPLWLVNDFKFDDAYIDTLTKREAAIWGKEEFPRNMRSLYVNIWDDQYYCGRLLINELDTPLKPGQFRLAEMFAEYVKIIMLKDMQHPQKIYSDYEDTVRTLIRGGEPDLRDVNALLEILGWRQGDTYVCLKLQSQSSDIQIKSDSALRSKLTAVFPRSFEFFHEQRLCMIINVTSDRRDGETIKADLAPLVRDSYMYCGISNPIIGLRKLRTGFDQTDITLNYILFRRSRWTMLFSECAPYYMIRTLANTMAPADLVSSDIQKLRAIDKEKNTDYYNTLRTYLENERSIPKTSEALIIHRTTLQYRLEKIAQLTHLNLDSRDVRMYLNISFRILDYVEATRPAAEQ